MSNTDESNIDDDELSVLRENNHTLETALRESRALADRRLMQAELKAEALKSGIIDLDGLKLVDPSDVTIGKDGEVRGADSAIARLRHGKPWLFKDANSSSLAVAPASAPTRNKMATEMTLDEWRIARAALLRRR
jgi:hypothetical protein